MYSLVVNSERSVWSLIKCREGIPLHTHLLDGLQWNTSIRFMVVAIDCLNLIPSRFSYGNYSKAVVNTLIVTRQCCHVEHGVRVSEYSLTCLGRPLG